jgi:hypothetical protein
MQLCEQFSTPGGRYPKETWERAELLCLSALRQTKAPWPGAKNEYLIHP